MSYTNLTNEFNYLDLIQWQNMDALAENDKSIRESFANYRRPNLVYVSATEVDMENNTVSLNETRIIFNDGEQRNVLEDTAATSKFRRFNITETADFSVSTENSGLRNGISEASNTWYALYAVKSQLNDVRFVLVGDTDLPILANITALDARYGVDGWIYLGLIRNGDGDSAPSDILSFKQTHERTVFNNTFDSETPGIKFLNTPAAGTQSWAYAAGTGGLVLPNNIAFAIWQTKLIGESTDFLLVQDSGGSRTYKAGVAYSSANLISQVIIPATEGIRIVSRAATTPKASLWGWVDNVLGLGFNPKT
ncbi:hypothetical protein LCGC14_0901090 [marine sediment metagenome]|uniref:Uncharacterized protein n=1 Tax=marine sediment metagenome TaxID=412755 RepID=A0A0F9NWG0_9ZZZZ